MRFNNCKINLFFISFFLFLISNSVDSIKGNPKITSTPKIITTTTTVPTTVSTTQKYEELDFVNGLETCKGVPSDHSCKKLCEIIEKSYNKSISKLSYTPYWISGGILAALTLISIVLCIKMCEIKRDHSEEMDLSGLSRREQIRQNLLAQPDPDAHSSKFKKQGPVVIATNLDYAFKKKCTDPTDVELGNVEYDEADNEQYDFGEEYDQFETMRADQSKMRTNSKSKTKSVQ